jgi:LacI family transcriptional regulator
MYNVDTSPAAATLVTRPKSPAVEERTTRSHAKLVDVARAAQVSTATVSRALSSPHLVADTARRRVEAAIRKLRYVPHGAARALRSQRTRTIGAIVPTLGNAIFANYIQALQKHLGDRGYRLLLSCNEYDANMEVALAAPLLQHGVDGLVLVGRDHAERLYRTLADHQVPYVLTWTSGRRGRPPCIGFDNAAAAREVADFLLELGHRRIAMIAGICKGNDRARERVTGVRRALAARGIALPASRVIERAYTFDAGREAMHGLMMLRPRPTAVICGNDVLAVGAIAECQAMEIDVPRAVSVTGFDDMDIARVVTPPLTTVYVPTDELGQAAAAYIVAKVEGAAHEPLAPMRVQIVERGTTARARLA